MKSRNLFRKASYSLTIDCHRVYRKWNRSITEWDEHEADRYMPELRSLVEKTVSNETWTLITSADRTSYPAYRSYVETVRDQLIEEFHLEAEKDAVKIGLYHSDMFVISFPINDLEKSPYYFRGIQLKPDLRNSKADKQK